MFDIFAQVKSFVKPKEVCIDDLLFKSHYRGTAGLLILCSLLVTARQYVGDPIDCMVDEIPGDVMDTFCWIYSTYTVPDKLKGRIGTDMIQPGVAPHIYNEDDVKYHKYYQWVGFVLFFQGILFYIPHYIWKYWEAKRIDNLTKGLRGLSSFISQDNDKEITKLTEEQEAEEVALKRIVKVLQLYTRTQTKYAFEFVTCEFLNIVNVIGQIVFIDFFLDWEFSKYGWDVFVLSGMDPELRTDPMARVFPKMTKCTFHKYGPSGTIQKFDGLCVLPVNILNEKIYAVLWLWFVILSIVSILFFIYRLLTINCQFIRNWLLRNTFNFASPIEVETVSSSMTHFGDWFMLNQIGKNIDPSHHERLINKLATS